LRHEYYPAGGTKKIDLLENRYDILNVIKSGAMGCVYKAVDTRLGNFVAIKKMLSSYTDVKDKQYAEKKFKEEAQLLSTLHHSGLPKVIDFFTEKDSSGKTSHYLVMTFIEGEDLESYFKNKRKPPIPTDKALDYFKQLLQILSHLHSQESPIIYRDMKPSNIMIKNSKLFLVDFGIARIFDTKSRGTMIGTPGYAAPEQYKGYAEPRSDIFSLGVLMHYLLTGHDPEDNQRAPFDFEPINKVNYNVPDYLESIVTSMIDVVSANRPESVKKIIEMLEKREIQAISPIANKINPKPQRVLAFIEKPLSVVIILLIIFIFFRVVSDQQRKVIYPQNNYGASHPAQTKKGSENVSTSPIPTIDNPNSGVTSSPIYVESATPSPDIAALNSPIVEEPGFINISTTPPKAHISLDGKYISLSPCTFKYKPGSYKIHITKRQYDDIDDEVKIESKKQTNFSAQFVLIQGSISVTTSPESAGIYVQNKYRGLSPMTVEELTPGKYDLMIKKDGYREISNTVTIERDKTTEVSYNLEVYVPPPQRVSAPDPRYTTFKNAAGIWIIEPKRVSAPAQHYATPAKKPESPSPKHQRVIAPTPQYSPPIVKPEPPPLPTGESSRNNPDTF
jgi:serine/threonine protein kinase